MRPREHSFSAATTCKYMLVIALVVLSFCFSAVNVYAASATGGSDDKKPEAEAPKDALGRDNPRSTISGFLDAIADQDYDKAANFLNLGNKTKQTDGADTAKQLQNLLDQSGWIRGTTTISNETTGDLDDDLPPELEKVGGIRTSKKVIPLLLEHIPAKKDQAAYWQFSTETISQIPNLGKEVGSSLLNKYLPQALIDQQLGGVPVGHWLALIVLAFLSYGVMWILTNLLKIIIHGVRRKISTAQTAESEIVNAFIKPLQLYLAVSVSVIIIRYIGVSLLARATFHQLSSILGWISLAWIVWRLIDVFSVILRDRLVSHGQYSMLSAVVFLRRGVKVFLFIIVAISILDSFGFQVTTWLAALGIGGIALALGAQKTVENFVGSLMLIADRPISIGDFCKFGNAKGTVEDIGMRSTRIRTADRTLVSIPNGDFASMQIENYSKRDSFYFNPVLGLSYETTPDQIRKISVKLRAMLADEDKVRKNSIRVNFIELSASSLNIEIACYIDVKTNDEAMDIKGDLNLKIMDIVDTCGSKFASPAPMPAPAKTLINSLNA